jgi:hypothetical protein
MLNRISVLPIFLKVPLSPLLMLWKAPFKNRGLNARAGSQALTRPAVKALRRDDFRPQNRQVFASKTRMDGESKPD